MYGPVSTTSASPLLRHRRLAEPFERVRNSGSRLSPKDRYYLYRPQWNRNDATLHILPHWNWKGNGGEEGAGSGLYLLSFPAELFINGKSYGKRTKTAATPLDYSEKQALPFRERQKSENADRVQDRKAMDRYRLIWEDAAHQPGEVRVVAYNADGSVAGEKSIRTSGKAARPELVPNRLRLDADGEDLVYITVRAVDKDGNFVPTDSREVKFTVKGGREIPGRRQRRPKVCAFSTSR